MLVACERSFICSIELRLSRYTRNSTFLTDSTLATKDPTATPYALFRGLANWWVCHLTKEDTGSHLHAANLSSDADRNRTLVIHTASFLLLPNPNSALRS